MTGIGRLTLAASIILIATTGAPTSRLLRAGGIELPWDTEVAGPKHDDHGAWRTKVQQVFDPATRTLSRRLYTIWDPEFSRDLDFIWTPDQPSAEKDGKINGTGHLVWRIRSKPIYDRSSVFAEYGGAIRNGRMEGHGTYLDHTGLLYEGEWKAGLVDGHGSLKTPSGDEYVGQFRAGKANGNGRYIDVTGEIFEGPFVAGQREGRGTTTLPNGHSYTSLWTNGKESDTSRLVRIAQGPGGRLPGAADDLRIAITLDKQLPPSSHPKATDRDGDRDLWYSVSNAANGLMIRPAKKRLMSVWKGGGEIQLLSDERGLHSDDFGVVSLTKGQLVPLNLMMEVQNRSSRQIQISGISFEVSSSVTDLQPAIQMSQESAFEDSSLSPTTPGSDTIDNHYYNPVYFIENFGWGDAREAQLHFAFVKATAAGKPAALPQNDSIGTIERSVKVDFELHLRAAGVDVDVLKRNSAEGFKCRTKSRPGCLSEIKSTRAFASLNDLVFLDDINIVVKTSGTLDYVWTDVAGTEHKASSPFNIKLPLGALKQEAEQGEFGAREIVTRKTQQLKLDETNYRIPIAYQTAVAANKTARLVLPIEAQKSSSHDFTMVVQLADGREIKSRPINLLYYRPRWYTSTNISDNVLVNYDLVGDDLQQLKDTTDFDCEMACKSNALCRAYTFDRWNQLCFLKNATKLTRLDPRYSSTLMTRTPKPSNSSALKVIARYQNKTFINDKSPNYGYLIEQQTDFESCEKRCAGDDACIAFTFRKRARNCYLYDQIDNETWSDRDADSGVKSQPAQ